MNATKKRVRSSKTRDARTYNFYGSIASRWAHAVKTQRPISEVHKAIVDEIAKLDLPEYQRTDLHARNWGSRDLVVQLHAEWCLYLDGKRVTMDEVPLDRCKDLHGRHEWRGTGKPFYDREDPTPLWTQPEQTSRV